MRAFSSALKLSVNRSLLAVLGHTTRRWGSDPFAGEDDGISRSVPEVLVLVRTPRTYRSAIYHRLTVRKPRETNCKPLVPLIPGTAPTLQ